jgi:hypothetical protein
MRAFGRVLVATIPLVYTSGVAWRRAPDDRRVVLAFNGLVLQWSQQVRGYTMAMFLITLATYLFVRTVDEPSTARGFVYGIVAVAAVATHFFSVLVIAAHAVSFLVMRPRPTRVFLLPAALIGGLLLPIALFVATANGDPLAWVDEPGGKVFGRALSRLAGGKFPLLVYCVLGAIGVFVTFRAVAEPRSPARSGLLPCAGRSPRARRRVQRPGHARVRRRSHRHPARCRAVVRSARGSPAPHAAGRGVGRTRRAHSSVPSVVRAGPRGLDEPRQSSPRKRARRRRRRPLSIGSVAGTTRRDEFDLTAEVPDSDRRRRLWGRRGR